MREAKTNKARAFRGKCKYVPHGLMGGMSVVEGIPKRLAVKLPLVLS